MDKLQSLNDLVDKPIDLHFYNQFLNQINKDLVRAGIDIQNLGQFSPKELHEEIQLLIKELLSTDVKKLVALFYLIDIPEKYLQQSLSTDVINPSETISFLILKREWQKVLTRIKYSQK
ncbi:hypothetical protein [Aegicerativicinus sediminis]